MLDKFRDYHPYGCTLWDVWIMTAKGFCCLLTMGELTEHMLHPSREVEKVYLARVSNQVTPEEAKRLERGVMVDGRYTSQAKARILDVKPMYTEMMITIHEGRNRQCAQNG